MMCCSEAVSANEWTVAWVKGHSMQTRATMGCVLTMNIRISYLINCEEAGSIRATYVYTVQLIYALCKTGYFKEYVRTEH